MASFAGQHETYLNVVGLQTAGETVLRGLASSYRPITTLVA